MIYIYISIWWLGAGADFFFFSIEYHLMLWNDQLPSCSGKAFPIINYHQNPSRDVGGPSCTKNRRIKITIRMRNQVRIWTTTIGRGDERGWTDENTTAIRKRWSLSSRTISEQLSEWKRSMLLSPLPLKDGCNKLQWYINTSKPWNNNKKYCRVHVNGHAFTLNHSSSPNRKRRSKPIDIVSFFNNTFPVHTQLVRRSNGRKTADIHIRAARIYVEYLILTIPCFNTVLGIVLQ